MCYHTLLRHLHTHPGITDVLPQFNAVPHIHTHPGITDVRLLRLQPDGVLLPLIQPPPEAPPVPLPPVPLPPAQAAAPLSLGNILSIRLPNFPDTIVAQWIRSVSTAGPDLLRLLLLGRLQLGRQGHGHERCCDDGLRRQWQSGQD